MNSELIRRPHNEKIKEVALAAVIMIVYVIMKHSPISVLRLTHNNLKSQIRLP